MKDELERNSMRPFFKKYHWIVPICGVFMYLLSPILMPVSLMLENWSDVTDYFEEANRALFYNPVKKQAEKIK